MSCLVTVGLLCLVGFVRGDSYRLPDNTIPSHYDVRLLYDIDPVTNFSFYGVVHILIKATKPTSEIVLHAKGFTIAAKNITLTGKSNSPAITGVDYNDTLDFLTLVFKEEIQANQDYALIIPFNGNLELGLEGAYISSYNTKDSKKEYLLVTHFEATRARNAFPCFDEPIYKASFKLTIGHDRDYTARSNMPLDKAEDVNALVTYWPWDVIKQTFKKEQSKFVWDTFKTSVAMSTYLVAYTISKFSYLESPSEFSHTNFRIWARKDAKDQTKYASEIGPKVLSHFEKWFNISFPLPKQDMFAIPDFSAGAMENWGLITYRESKLLYCKKESSFTNKEGVAEVIAHELTHQWFGNLVTMQWWSDLWLNEGFATYSAGVGVNAVEPTWHAEDNNAVDNMMSVFDLDALESSHPVSVPVEDPNRISEIFDVISYRKGATIIRMMSSFLGKTVFDNGLHNYLLKYSYKNAEQDDLWQELTDVGIKHKALPKNVTVKRIMDTWTRQTGYPLITVQRDYSTKTLTVTQRRYLALEPNKESTAAWWVPLNVLCQRNDVNSPAPLQWLADDEGLKNVRQFDHESGADEWVLFNPDMMGLYRVNYDSRNWELLAAALKKKHKSLPVLGRVQLLSDAFELAWTNRLDYTIALQLTGYLHCEHDYLALSTGLLGLSKIENVIRRRSEFGIYQKYVRKLLERTYEHVGGLSAKKILNEDDLNSVKMQTLTSSWACAMKVPGCEDNAMEMFQKWMDCKNPDENNPIPVDLRREVYCVGVARGTVRHWHFILARKRNTNVASARNALLAALACTREVWLLHMYLEWTITDETEVRRQDYPLVMSAIMRSTVGFYVAKDFIYSRIRDIYTAFHQQGSRIGLIINDMLAQFTTQHELDEFLEWRQKNAKYLEDAKLGVEQAVERARVNIAWLHKNTKVVVDTLKELSEEMKDRKEQFKLVSDLPREAAFDGASRGQVTNVMCLLYLLGRVTCASIAVL